MSLPVGRQGLDAPVSERGVLCRCETCLPCPG